MRAVAVNGDFAYAAASHRGLEIYDLSGGKIAPAGRINCPYASDVKVSDGRLAVALGFGGVGIYDISGRFAANPRKSGAYPQTGRARPSSKTSGHSTAANLWAFRARGFPSCFSTYPTPHRRRGFFAGGLPAALQRLRFPKARGGQVFRSQQALRRAHDFRHVGRQAQDSLYDDRPLCSQTGSVAAFGGKILTMFRGGYAVDDPSAPAENGKLKRENSRAAAHCLPFPEGRRK